MENPDRFNAGNLVAPQLSEPNWASVFEEESLESCLLRGHHPSGRDMFLIEGVDFRDLYITNSKYQGMFMALPDKPAHYTNLEEQGDVLIVGFKMRMLNDEENIEQLGQELFALVEQYHWLKLVLDLSNVDYLTSSVLGKLITLHRKLHRNQGKMALFGLTAGVHGILNTSKLLNYFLVADSKVGALALLA